MLGLMCHLQMVLKRGEVIGLTLAIIAFFASIFNGLSSMTIFYPYLLQ